MTKQDFLIRILATHKLNTSEKLLLIILTQVADEKKWQVSISNSSLQGYLNGTREVLARAQSGLIDKGFVKTLHKASAPYNRYQILMKNLNCLD